MDIRERQIRQRLKDDFEHYAQRCLKIRTKSGEVVPLELNDAQKYIHFRLEQQLSTLGRIRALILKGRQQGSSTYVEGRYYWEVTHRRGVRAFILTHQDDATNNLFGMAKRYHENCPDVVKPVTSASNARELIFCNLDSGYKVGTAGSKGVGRSDTIQYFHGSEVAYWPHAQEHMSGVLQAVPNEPGTEIILESTSAGPQGVFYELCQEALAGQGQYELIFVPWFWQSEYREPVPEGFEPTADEQAYAETYNLDLEQIVWMRAKIKELRGLPKFRQEYPATPEEAFQADVEGALWKRELIDANRVLNAPQLSRIVVAIDPAVTSDPDSCEHGIGAAGIGEDGHAYVLVDVSRQGTPDQAAKTAIDLYKSLQADRVIGEVNNGGDWIESLLHTVDKRVPYKSVHASRGKAVRAEPITALYEQGMVHHVGAFSTLEDQMCTWVPGRSDYSPDRIDWLVWALTELMLDAKGEPRLRVL